MNKLFCQFSRFATICVLVVFCSFSAKAQLENNIRIELPIVGSMEVYRDVFPLGGKGVLLLSRNNPLFERKALWTFTRYTTDLKVTWSVDFKPEVKFAPVISFYNSDHAYWLFVVPESKQYMFLQVNLHDGSMDVREGQLLAGIDIQEFKVIGSKALIAGYYRGRPIVVVYSFFDQSMNVLPGLFEKNMEINSIDVDEVVGQIHVLTYAYRKKHCQFEIKTYDYEGKMIKNTILRDERNSFISGQMLTLDEENTYLIGNYSIGCSQYSQGIYLSRLDDDNELKADFIEFSELQNFFNYLKPKRRQKMLEKLGRRKSMGKENRFRYRLLVHQLIETEDEVVLVAEVYYPHYKTTSSPYITAGAFSRNYIRIDDGYRYTHAIVCGFDKNNGKLKWDNSFALKNLMSNQLQEKVQLTKVGKYYVLAYPDQEGIHTEVIQQNKTVMDKEKYEMKSGTDYEKVVDQEAATVLAWYDQYFMSYGVQKVKIDRQLKASQNSAPEAHHREVFYIQKMSYNTSTIEAENLP